MEQNEKKRREITKKTEVKLPNKHQLTIGNKHQIHTPCSQTKKNVIYFYSFPEEKKPPPLKLMPRRRSITLKSTFTVLLEINCTTTSSFSTSKY